MGHPHCAEARLACSALQVQLAGALGRRNVSVPNSIQSPIHNSTTYKSPLLPSTQGDSPRRSPGRFLLQINHGTCGHRSKDHHSNIPQADETPAYILGALTSVGGVTGYVRTGSVPSIVAGLTVGALVRAISFPPLDYLSIDLELVDPDNTPSTASVASAFQRNKHTASSLLSLPPLS